ncbi:MFS transporter [Salinispirillum sp. LH 10-3-1]|uniref:MFS transporter n=1 Tax=Salinispirillum sp. LH 10-3-1 TaxID=2952525 RepID=A0AB38YGK6_9GAMM
MKKQLNILNLKYSVQMLWFPCIFGLILLQGIVSFFIVMHISLETDARNFLPLVSTLAIAPGIYFSFFSGKLIDKLGERHVVLSFLSIYLIAAFYVTHLGSRSEITLIALLAFVFIQSIVSSTLVIAITSMIPKLFSKGKLRLTYAAYSFISGSAMTFSPAIAGIFYGSIELKETFTTLFLFTLLFLLFTILYMPKANNERKKYSTKLLYYFNELMTSGLYRLSFYYLVLNTLNGVTIILIPLYIIKLMNNDHIALALVSSAIAFSSLIGIAFSAKSFPVSNHKVIALTTIAGAILGRIFLPLASEVIIICLLVAFRSIALEVGNMANQMEWIEHTNTDNRAGMLGLRRLFGQGLFPIASLALSLTLVVGGYDLELGTISKIFIVSGVLELCVSIYFLKVIKDSGTYEASTSVDEREAA